MNKVVVLAAGMGTRMRNSQAAGLSEAQQQVADRGVKALVPIDRPFLDYVLSTVADAGFDRVCLVIGPDHEELRTYYSSVDARRLQFEFVVQPKPLGTADAVATAREFCADDPFLAINSDNHYPLEALRALRDLSQPGLCAFDRDALVEKSNIPAERIERFAVVDVTEDGNLSTVVEKPTRQWMENLRGRVGVSMNCWRFDEDIFPACVAIEPSERGELEIASAVQYAIDELNTVFRVVESHAPVLDLTSREDIESVAQRLRGQQVQL